jgi:Flp pilus assembly pilin Flp
MWTKLNHLLLSLARRTRRESGQVLVEYALVLVLVSLVTIALLIIIGQDLSGPLKPVVEGFEKA